MKRLMRPAKVTVAAIIVVFTVPTMLRSQTANDLDSAARERIQQARASIVKVAAQNSSGETVRAIGFFVRKDLIATAIPEIRTIARVQVTSSTKGETLKVSSWGHYLIPYLLMESNQEIPPLKLGDSERVSINDPIYMIDDSRTIVGTVTGTVIIDRAPAFLLSFSTTNRKGAPIFNRNGEVIGIAAESPGEKSIGVAISSSELASLTHLGEPGVGVGRGDGVLRPVVPSSIEPKTSNLRVDKRPVRISGPPPRYTEEARQNHINGTVILSVLVGADGSVKQVRVVSGLPYGLNDRAIEAARETKFKPAMKDGQPVPFWVGLQMEFNIR